MSPARARAISVGVARPSDATGSAPQVQLVDLGVHRRRAVAQIGDPQQHVASGATVQVEGGVAGDARRRAPPASPSPPRVVGTVSASDT